MTISTTHRAARRLRGAAVGLGLLLLACGSRPDVALPSLPPPAGQLPANYQLEATRGVVLARLVVVTDGEPGFGPITNPLLVQLQPTDDPGEVFDPLGNDARVWTTASQRPSQWRYEPPGLLAMSVAPGSYSGLLLAYPDASHATATPSSIPSLSAGLVIAPLEVPAGTIVYVGDIEIRQTVSTWDWLLDRVEVTYAVRDDYDRAVADLRARYPQLAETPVERRVAQVIAAP